jgi:hypothetical protein
MVSFADNDLFDANPLLATIDHLQAAKVVVPGSFKFDLFWCVLSGMRGYDSARRTT